MAASSSNLPPALKARLLKKGISLGDSTISAGPALKSDINPCPNKSNPYHECTDYCKERWGGASKTPTTPTELKVTGFYLIT